MMQPTSGFGQPRRGTILFVVLAVMATLTLLAATMLRGVQLSRHRFRTELHVRQADQLLDAAIAAARSRMNGQAPFSESRTIPGAEISGGQPARLTVTVKPVPPGTWQIEAVVEYPADDFHPVRRRRSRLVAAHSSATRSQKSPNQPPSPRELQ